MKRFAVSSKIVQVVIVWGVLLGIPAGFAIAQPDSQHAKAEMSSDLSLQAVVRQSLDKALLGKFSSALDDLKQASDPNDARTSKTIAVLEDYLQRLQAAQEERLDEYQYEVERLAWANLAQEYKPTLDKADFLKELRTTVNEDLRDAYHDIGTANTFEEASAETAQAMVETSIQACQTAKTELAKAVDYFQGRSGSYVEQFRAIAADVDATLTEASELWKQLDPSSAKGRWQGALRIRPVEEKLADHLTDLEVMISKHPWKIALIHGRLAKEIAPEDVNVAEKQWFKQLLVDAEQRGETAVEESRWYDALNAFSALEDLEPANETYRERAKFARRHARVLRLYGQEETDEDLDEEEPDLAEEQDDWRDMVEGADAQMVVTAIGKLKDSYVTSVDFRRLTRSALKSIQILAKTPQVRKTFPGLEDETKRKEFLTRLEEELAELDKKDRVDQLTLVRALHSVLRYSEQSVEIPLEVLAVEFADGFLDEMDPFSTMIWPYDVTNFNKSTMGRFTGIGVQITKEPDEPLKVVSPLLGTPAYEAGIKAGDFILKVDDMRTEKHSVDYLVKHIMGPEDSKVTLTIKRRGIADPFEVEIVRKPVAIRTVLGWQRHLDGQWDYILDEEKKIGYIRLKQFTQATHENLAKALNDLQKKGIVSIVLDLRSNPGGLLRSATAVADEFLQSGRIVYTQGRQVPRNDINAENKGLFTMGDLVVLVDNHSASAAEILSGALQDWQRAVIVGQRSYGKGSVQNVIPIPNREAYLKLTTAYYYLPFGRRLHREPDMTDWGVNPDVPVYISPRQMRRWVNIRRKTELIQEYDPELHQADLDMQYDEDIQLNAAVTLLELMRLKREVAGDSSVAEAGEK